MTGYVKANTGSNPNAFNVRGVEAMRCDNRSNAARRGERAGNRQGAAEDRMFSRVFRRHLLRVLRGCAEWPIEAGISGPEQTY